MSSSDTSLRSRLYNLVSKRHQKRANHTDKDSIANTQAKLEEKRDHHGKNTTDALSFIALIIKYALISAKVERKQQSPLSIGLIANCEEGKTRLMLLFQHVKKTTWQIIENLSARPLNKFIKDQDEKQEYWHLIILDMNRILQGKSAVVESLVGTLLNLIDEGCQKCMFYGQEYILKTRIQMGIIFGMVPVYFEHYFYDWNQSGYLSRIFWISWHYSKQRQIEIHNKISEAVKFQIEDANLKIKQRGKQKIEISKDVGSAIEFVFFELKAKLDKYFIVKYFGKTSKKIYVSNDGFRLHQELRLLAQSIAYERGANAVNYEDVKLLKMLCEFVGFPERTYETIKNENEEERKIIHYGKEI